MEICHQASVATCFLGGPRHVLSQVSQPPPDYPRIGFLHCSHLWRPNPGERQGRREIDQSTHWLGLPVEMHTAHLTNICVCVQLLLVDPPSQSMQVVQLAASP